MRRRDDESALSAAIVSSEALRSEGETRTLGDGLRELDEADSTQPSVAAATPRAAAESKELTPFSMASSN